MIGIEMDVSQRQGRREWIAARIREDESLDNPPNIRSRAVAARAMLAATYDHMQTVDDVWGCCHGAAQFADDQPPPGHRSPCRNFPPDVIDGHPGIVAVSLLWSHRPDFPPAIP